MDLTGLTERKQRENHRHDEKGTIHGDYKNTNAGTLTSDAPNKHSAENQSRKRGRNLFSFVFSVYTATILFAVFITFTCAFLIVRIQELEVFLYHQDGYIRELRTQFEGLNQGEQATENDQLNKISSVSSSMPEINNRVSIDYSIIFCNKMLFCLMQY